MKYRVDNYNLKRQDIRDQLREEAVERQTDYDTLTPQQKLDRLDAKLGKDSGAVKQRLRLHQCLSIEK